MVGVLEDQKIAYFAVHKAASTTVKSALYEFKFGQIAPHADVHRAFQMPAVTQEMFDAYRDYWCFTVVRDPIKRFLSAVQNRIHDRGRLKIVRKRGGRLGRLGLRRKPKPFPSFQTRPDISAFIRDYDLYCAASNDLRMHTTSVVTLIGNDLSYFDAIYTTSELDRLQEDLSKRLGAEVTFRRENPSRVKPPKFEDLTPSEQDFLLEHTASDYALLSDYFSAPSRSTLDPAQGGHLQPRAQENSSGNTNDGIRQ